MNKTPHVALLCLLLGSCAVGPDFVQPAAPALDRYSAQTIEPGQKTAPDWWRQFGSAGLNDLVAAGLLNSPTLQSATAALEQSKYLARAGAGVFYPQINGSFGALQEHTSPASLGGKGEGSTFSLNTLAGAVSYTLDVFGGERRTVEALDAQAEYQRDAVGAAYLLLTGNIVDAVIAGAGYGDEATTLADIVQMDTAQRDILNAQYQSGFGALSAVLAAEQVLAADRQSLSVSQQRRDASVTLLKTLIGRETGTATPPLPMLSDLAMPANVPVSLPSELVRKRPDILQAEATLHQASALVGVATAALFPSISLTGNYGAASTQLAGLSSPAGRFWSVGPSLNIPLFNGGALWFGRKAAQAELVKTEADYRQTVLAALEQVADQLKALDADAETASAYRSAVDASGLDNQLAADKLKTGVIADFDLMTTKILDDRARLGLIAAKSQQLQDVVGLCIASGGGWTGQAAVAK